MRKALASNAVARSAVLSSKAALDAAHQQLGVIDAQIGEARAAIAEAEADLRTAELNLGYTEIRSPIEGYIGNRAAQSGAYVAGGAYLVTVIPAHELWVDANFKEDQLRHMSPGQEVTVSPDTLPDHAFRGRELSLSPGTGSIFELIRPRECDRKLHQDRAARSRPHRARHERPRASRVAARALDDRER